MAQHPVLALQLAQAGTLIAAEDIGALTAVGLVLSQPVAQRLLGAAQLAGEFPRGPRARAQQAERLAPELGAVVSFPSPLLARALARKGRGVNGSESTPSTPEPSHPFHQRPNLSQRAEILQHTPEMLVGAGVIPSSSRLCWSPDSQIQ